MTGHTSCGKLKFDYSNADPFLLYEMYTGADSRYSHIHDSMTFDPVYKRRYHPNIFGMVNSQCIANSQL